MKTNYLTVYQEAEAEFVEKKSRFIGYATPIQSEAEGAAFIEKIRSMHKQATHVVPVYVYGGQYECQRYSDDGEPSGTAGIPILSMVKQRNIKNIAIAVVRYFGGTKLGTGGLVRAYTHCAQLAIEAAILIEQVQMSGYRLTIDYTKYGKLQNELETRPYEIVSQEFLDRVGIEVAARSESQEALHAYLLNFTQGKEVLNQLRPRFVPCKDGRVDGDDFLLSEDWVEGSQN
jgi:uncharacterized YigZ family protein